MNTPKRFYYGYVIVAAIFLIQIVMFGPRGAYGVFIKPLSLEFEWSRALVSGAFAFANIVQGFSSILMGALNDKYGPRIVMTLCGLLVGSGLLLISTVHTWWQLYLFYILLVGLGMGGLFVPQMSTINRWFKQRSNLMASVVLVGGGVGGIIAPPLFNWLVYSRDWRTAFLIIGAYAMFFIILAAQFLKRDPSKIQQEPASNLKIKHTTKIMPDSGIDFQEAVRTRQFWMVATIMFCYGFSIMTVMIHLVPFATDAGISSSNAANILALMSGATPIGGIVIGLIADRFGVKRILTICFLLLACVLGLLLPVKTEWVIGVFAAIVAIGGGGISTIHAALVTSLFGLKSHGLIFGVLVFCFSIGSAAGTFLGGYFYDITGNYEAVFLLCGGLSIAGFLISILLKPAKQITVINGGYTS